MELLRDTGLVKVLYQVLRSCPVATVKKRAKLLLLKWKKLCAGTHLSTGNFCQQEAEDPVQVGAGNGACPRGDGGGSCASFDRSVPQETEEQEQGGVTCGTGEGRSVSEQSLSRREAGGHVTPEGAPSVEDSAAGTSALDRGGNARAASLGVFTREPSDTFQITAAHTSPNNNASSLRSKCAQLLLQALEPEEAEGPGLAPNLRELAHDIEQHIFKLNGQNKLKYKSCVRSKVSNLKNPKSPHLRQGLLRGQLGPEAFARMSAMEMASRELKELRAEYTESGIREHQRPLGVEGTPTDKIRCRSCNRFDCRVTQISRGALFLPGWVRTGNPDEDAMTFVTCTGCGEK
ncbi:hypothetical protein AAFF_G00243700 [Aldrovandia affinis]|uniref:Transcription elongation factor TFIIS n=1 Tax=Aldrovandia affinis TaxID=143900 RepID=A0AAD7W3I0_9TELE|nr:hypothetical protein AAFF_G00243700 [Aldrovandia affinis]